MRKKDIQICKSLAISNAVGCEVGNSRKCLDWNFTLKLWTSIVAVSWDGFGYHYIYLAGFWIRRKALEICKRECMFHKVVFVIMLWVGHFLQTKMFCTKAAHNIYEERWYNWEKGRRLGNNSYVYLVLFLRKHSF